MDQIAAG